MCPRVRSRARRRAAVAQQSPKGGVTVDPPVLFEDSATELDLRFHAADRHPSSSPPSARRRRIRSGRGGKAMTPGSSVVAPLPVSPVSPTGSTDRPRLRGPAAAPPAARVVRRGCPVALASAGRVDLLPGRAAAGVAGVLSAARGGTCARSASGHANPMTRHPRLVQTVLDTTEPRRLAEFYRRLLGYAYRPGDEPAGSSESAVEGSVPDEPEWLVLRDTQGTNKLALCVPKGSVRNSSVTSTMTRTNRSMSSRTRPGTLSASSSPSPPPEPLPSPRRGSVHPRSGLVNNATESSTADALE